MPVPLIYADKPLQVLEQRNAGQAWGEVGNAGRAVTGLAETISRQQAELIERAKLAEDNLAAVEYSNNVQKDMRDLQGLFENDNDPFTIEDRATQQAKAIADKYSPKNPSDRLNLKTKSIFSQEYNSFLNGIQTKKYKLLDSHGKEAYLKAEQTAIDEINSTNDPVEQARIKKRLEETKGALSQASDPLWLEKEWIGFDAKAKGIGETKAITAAQNHIIGNPAGGSKILKATPFWDRVPDERKPELIKSADTAKKIFDNELESKEKEAAKAAHDAEERTVGDLYMNKDYAKAYAAAQNSNLLTGNEKKAWADSINTKLEKREDINPTVAANEIVKINAMISGEEDPNKIRNYVVQTPNLKKEDKEQYLNKLELKLSSDENEGRKVGYSRIKDIIIPKRGILNPLTETPQETLNVRKAQDALDEWIDIQKKGKKYPTSTEIKAKADQFGNMYQIPLAQKMEEIETGAKNVAGQIKVFSEQKKEYSKIPEADRKFIEEELIRGGFPATMANVISVHKRNYLDVK